MIVIIKIQEQKMAKKTLKELLYKFLSPPEFMDIMLEGEVTRTRVDKEKRILEVYADFQNIIQILSLSFCIYFICFLPKKFYDRKLLLPSFYFQLKYPSYQNR